MGSSDNAAEDSVVDFQQIHNFRDFGGYPVAGGGIVRSGRLFRSGDLSKATKDDWEAIEALRIETIIDLRGKSERIAAPVHVLDGSSISVLTSELETAKMAPHVESATRAVEPKEIRREMEARYTEMPFRPGLVDTFRQCFELLARTDKPVLICCSAGKDRTGLLAGLVLHILGVCREHVLEDYLRTAAGPRQKERIDALRGELEKRFGPGLSDEAIEVITGVDPRFLGAALDAIAERFNSIESYLCDMLQVQSEAIEKIRIRLIK